MIMHSYFKYHWPRSRFKVTLVVKEVTCTKNTPKSLLFVYMDSILFVHCQIWPKKSQICCEMSIIFWHHFWKGYSELISNEKTVDKQLITIIFYKSSTSLSTKNPWCSSPFYIAHWAILHFFPFYTHTHTHTHTYYFMGLPMWLRGKQFNCQCRKHRRPRFDPWVRKIPWWRK